MSATIQLEVSGLEFSTDLHTVLESLTEEDKRGLAKELLKKALLERNFSIEWTEAETKKWVEQRRAEGHSVRDYDITEYKRRLEEPINKLRSEFLQRAYEMAKTECTEALKSDENVEFFRQVKEQMVKSMPNLMVTVMTQMLIGQIAGAASQVQLNSQMMFNFNGELNMIRSRLGLPMQP